MHFGLRKDATAWFRSIDDMFEIDFDKYYFCLMLGFAAGKKTSRAELRDLTDTFPEQWRAKARLIIGLLISAHLESLGISLDERDAVNKEVAILLDPESPTKLSNDGMRLLNEYASGGFDVLFEKMEKPYAPEDFLRHYVVVVRESEAQRSR